MTPPSQESSPAPSRTEVQSLDLPVKISSMLVAVVGFFVLVGWFLQSEMMISVIPGRVAMKFTTAACFVASGAALYLSIRGSRRAKLLSRILSTSIVTIATLTLLEYLLKLNLGIDELLLRDPFQPVHPGRMSYITAVVFILSGVALFLLNGNSLARRVAQIVSLTVTSIAFASIVGYLYGVPLLYGSLSNVNTMALNTGACFLVLGIGATLAHPESTTVQTLAGAETGSWLTRRTLPLLILFPVVLGFVYSYPSVNRGHPRFGMALFAVTLVLIDAAALIAVGASLNRMDRQRQDLLQAARESAAAIERSERELRLINDNLPTPISYIDLTGRFLRVNRTYQQWLGRPESEIVGQFVRALVGEATWESTRPAREAAASGHAASVEIPYPTRLGDRRAVVTYAPDRDNSGILRGFAVMVVDVEDQRRAEAALRQAEKLAAVGRLSSSIAHEINNPIDAVMNLLYLIREETRDSEAKALLEIADGELKRIANIANQTLRFHKQTGRPERVSPTELIASILVLHDYRLLNLQIHVQRRERATEPLECIEGEIRQVLNNLIINAVDAMQPGGRLLIRTRPAIHWSSGRPGIAFTVADTGCGISPDIRKHVFEAFFTTKGIAGTGLGLWITDEILTRHGGSMRIRSSTRPTDHGTVFVLFLPLTMPPQPIPTPTHESTLQPV